MSSFACLRFAVLHRQKRKRKRNYTKNYFYFETLEVKKSVNCVRERALIFVYYFFELRMVILIVKIFSFRYEKFDKGGFSETKDSDVENWIHPGWYTSREICRPRRRWMKTRLWECFLSWRSVEGKSDVLNLKLFYVISRDNSGWWRWVVRIFADAERFAEEGEMNSNSTASRFVHVDDDITSITYTYEEYQNTAFVNDTFIHSNESLPPKDFLRIIRIIRSNFRDFFHRSLFLRINFFEGMEKN